MRQGARGRELRCGFSTLLAAFFRTTVRSLSNGNSEDSPVDTSRGNPKRLEVLIVNDDEQAPSLLNPLTGQMLITNPVGKRIVELADGNRNLEAIAAQIAQEFRGARLQDVLQHAESFLAEGEKKGVVTWTSQS
jgi:hypothetical protein